MQKCWLIIFFTFIIACNKKDNVIEKDLKIPGVYKGEKEYMRLDSTYSPQYVKMDTSTIPEKIEVRKINNELIQIGIFNSEKKQYTYDEAGHYSSITNREVSYEKTDIYFFPEKDSVYVKYEMYNWGSTASIYELIEFKGKR